MQLRVFPNTGHQFFDIQLADLLPGRDEDFLEKLALTNRGPWQTWRGIPWVLYQYAIIEGIPTLKVAIETNLGLPSRGLLFDYEDELLGDRPDDDEIMEVYAASEEARIEEDYKNRTITLRTLPNKDDLPLDIELEIFWPPRGGWDPVDVDLIVDLGNTRTIALLLETPGQGTANQPFGRRVTILRILPRGTPYTAPTGNAEGGILADDCAIIDSWLLLHRPLFYHLEPPHNRQKLSANYRPIGNPGDGEVQYRLQYFLPNSFVELSPALVGGGRSHPEGVSKTLGGVPLDKDARFALSSPKRYAWDDEPQGRRGGTFWKQIPNPTDETPPDYYDEFRCLIRYFMEPSGVDWDIDEPPVAEEQYARLPSIDAPAEYPRRDAICWFALSILEAAYRQINAEQYLRKVGRESLPRRLRNVRVTYPAGWIYEERSRYLSQWQRAINLFTLARFPDLREVNPTSPHQGGARPRLIDDGIDEAVSSQLPILYADIKALGDPRTWIELFGSDGSVTVMNVDIGGGTTDLSIIRYGAASTGSTYESKSLNTRLLFRDGYSTAGDTLVKRLIEQVLLPVWLKASANPSFNEIPEAKRWLKRFLADPAHAEFSPVDPKASVKLMRVTRLVFIPLVNAWLEQLASLDANPDRSWEAFDLDDLLEREVIDRNAINDLNELVDRTIRLKCAKGNIWEGPAFATHGIRISAERSQIEECIDGVFTGHFRNLGALAGFFDCQMVIVSGKPSEQPRIRELLTRSFPLLPQRIINVKNFVAGSWYPFNTFDGIRIADAKTCTVVGAALFQDMNNGALEALNVIPETRTEISRRYYWNYVSREDPPERFHRNYLFSPADYPDAGEGDRIQTDAKAFEMPLNCRIGRQLVRMNDVRAEPVYELQWRPSNTQPNPDARARVTLRWVSVRGEGERLELVSVKALPDFPEVQPEEVQLKLNTLFEESYWLDEPQYNTDHLFEETAAEEPVLGGV
ncbi:MAG: virulence factor SrfB [Opitutales bacterium]